MPLVFGCIVPHGDVIPELASAAAAARTTAAMQEIGRRMEAAAPDTVVVVTPHGIRVDGAMAISLSEQAAGGLADDLFSEEGARAIHVEFEVDQGSARDIQMVASREGLPTAMVHYGATRGPHDRYPLDWGAVVPLWFLGAHFARKPKVVLVVPSRVLKLEDMVTFGRAVAGAAAASERRVAVVASSDLGHAHLASGPYGYHPAAAEFDGWVVAAVQDGALTRLLEADMDLVAQAHPDGLWQILVLAGVMEHTPMRGGFLEYEAPTYYGMLCAAYAPDGA